MDPTLIIFCLFDSSLSEIDRYYFLLGSYQKHREANKRTKQFQSSSLNKIINKSKMYHHRHPHPDLPAIPEEADGSSVVDSVFDPFSPTETIHDSDGVDGDNNDVATDDEEQDKNSNNDEEEGSVDDASKAESIANSCAFSLDNVGFDEESSIAGSIAGHSIVGTNVGRSGDSSGLSLGNSSVNSLFHTPPLRYSVDSKCKQEQMLHRETCRTLGLPYNEDWLDTNSSSSSDVGSGSFLGSISASSGSTDELDRTRKIDKIWPWPTAKRKMMKNIAEDDVSMAEEMSDRITNSTSSSKLEVSMTKISGVKSACTNNMKGAWTAINDRIENAYDKTCSKQNSNHHQDVDPGIIESNVEASRLETHTSMRPSYIQQIFHPSMWANLYNESNLRTKIAIGTSMMFVLLCIIIIPSTTIGKSQSSEVTSSSGWVHDNPVIPTTPNSLTNGKTNITAVPSNSVETPTLPTESITVGTPAVATNPTESSTVATTSIVTIPSGFTSIAASVIPTVSHATVNPNNVGTSNNTDGTSSCTDMIGKFTNSKGKQRTCHWLSVRAAGSLYSAILDIECGGGEGSEETAGDGQLMKPSELGSSCQHTCRSYNGCGGFEEGVGEIYLETNRSEYSTNLTNSSAVGGDAFVVETNSTLSNESGKENAGSSPMKSTNSSAIDDDGVVIETNSTVSNGETGQDNTTTSLAINSSNSSAAKDDNNTDDDDYNDEGRESSHSLPSFIDTRGKERLCSFLDIRNRKQRSRRRNANCVNEVVRSTCPNSCSIYFTDNMTAIFNVSQEVAGSYSGGGYETAQQDSAMIDAEESLSELGDAMTSLSALRVDTGKNDNDTLSIEAVEGVEENAVEEDVITPSCLDNPGYYLNHRGRAVQCSWLIDGRDPTHESRRINNCGYGGDANGKNELLPEASDLGKMCKNTCGTCDQPK